MDGAVEDARPQVGFEVGALRVAAGDGTSNSDSQTAVGGVLFDGGNLGAARVAKIQPICHAQQGREHQGAMLRLQWQRGEIGVIEQGLQCFGFEAARVQQRDDGGDARVFGRELRRRLRGELLVAGEVVLLRRDVHAHVMQLRNFAQEFPVGGGAGVPRLQQIEQGCGMMPHRIQVDEVHLGSVCRGDGYRRFHRCGRGNGGFSGGWFRSVRFDGGGRGRCAAQLFREDAQPLLTPFGQPVPHAPFRHSRFLGGFDLRGAVGEQQQRLRAAPIHAGLRCQCGEERVFGGAQREAGGSRHFHPKKGERALQFGFGVGAQLPRLL